MSLRGAGFTLSEIDGMGVADVYDLRQIIYDDAVMANDKEQELWSQALQTP